MSHAILPVGPVPYRCPHCGTERPDFLCAYGEGGGVALRVGYVVIICDGKYAEARPCDACNGTGVELIGPEIKDCPACTATGKVAEAKDCQRILSVCVVKCEINTSLVGL